MRPASQEMTPMPEPISATRAAIAIGLVTFAAFAFWASEGETNRMLGLSVIAANFVMTSRSDRTRSVSMDQLFAILLILALLVLPIFLFPGDRTDATIHCQIEWFRWYSQLYFVLPVWALLCRSHYRCYRRSWQGSDTTPTAITAP